MYPIDPLKLRHLYERTTIYSVYNLTMFFAITHVFKLDI